MGDERKILIHASKSILWQGAAAQKMQQGLKAIGLDSKITDSRFRTSDIAICMGTTLWRSVERTGDYLLVDRASWGDPDYVSLVWNGHGRRGDHMVPKSMGDRAKKIAPELKPWRLGDHVILCGQTETYSPHYDKIEDWYSKISADFFRGHPAGENPTNLPRCTNWNTCGLAITLNSSVGVDAVIAGVPTVTMDEGAMAWDVSSHDQFDLVTPDRRPWINWMSWTQWHWDEIQDGKPIKHLFREI